MARMTPEEANSVNIVISYLAGRGDDLPDEVVRSLETLASRAHNRLQTGWDEKAVRKYWPAAFPEAAARRDAPARPLTGPSGGVPASPATPTP